MKHLLILSLLALSAHALPVVERLPLTQLNAQNDAWVAAGGSTAWADYTGSMRPYLKGGETVLMERMTWRTGLSVGDLVVIITPSGPLIHEVVALRGGYAQTKGRANQYDDGWYPPTQVKWVVKRVLREARVGA